MNAPVTTLTGEKSSRPVKILVTGGGTAGHISPALALISTLKQLEPETQFLYVGSHGGLEKSQVEAVNVPFVAVSTGKLRRYLSFSNLIDQFRVPLGIWQALKVVKSFAPDVVMATGGYVAVPTVIAAGLLKIPILIHEQTAQVGLANRICARFATRIALSWEAALRSLDPKLRTRAWVVGNPVRPQIFGGVANNARQHFGLSDEFLPVVYVTGGSLGARVINRAIEEALPELVQSARVIHQCGAQENEAEKDFDRLTRARLLLPEAVRARYIVAPFIREELKDVFALADFVVGRAGAGTLAELCALGKPALYIPLVPTGGDEQTKNARMAQAAGAAKILSQEECTGPSLLAAIADLTKDKSQLSAMGEQAKSLAKPAAARDIAKAVLDLARGS